MQLQSLLSEYCASNQRIQSVKTIRLLRVCVGHFERFLEREAFASDLTDTNIARFAASRREQGRAASTVDGEVAKLLALQRYALLVRLVAPAATRVAAKKTSVGGRVGAGLGVGRGPVSAGVRAYTRT